MDSAKETKEQIRNIAKEHNTDQNYTTFILGPYEPYGCRVLLTKCRNKLRDRYGITAFLEDDIHISFDQTELCNVLAGIADLSAFIIPKNFKSDGWKTEIGQLLPKYSNKIAVYYESIRSFPVTTKNLMASCQIYQPQIIESKKVQSSVESVCNHINTILLKLHPFATIKS